MSLDGLLLLDKPAGPTSFEVVRRVRRAVKVKKAGHLGTLDPFATGLLPLALGAATRLAPFLEDLDKTYLAEVELGRETDTQDLTGRVVAEHPVAVSEAEIRTQAARFVGEIEQVPPLYSALRHQGRRLYELARRGIAVEVRPRKVTIHRLEIREICLPRVVLEVTCSKGTYMRTLAHDLGRALGTGGVLAALRRLAVGPFRVEEALPLAEVTHHPELARERLIPLADCLPFLPALQVDPGHAQRLAQGQAVSHPPPQGTVPGRVRVLADGRLLAVAEWRRDPRGLLLAPVRVFRPPL
ncbi:MAG: tRNA pseudouridine(55) synthase TruB [Syntrophobacterales bacterium]|nr:tRNA pseudouridine(55) synthase TruB [Syntrophobacterales bacterium]